LLDVPLAGFPDLPHPCRFTPNTQGVTFTPDSQYILVQNYVEQELAAYKVSGKGHGQASYAGLRRRAMMKKPVWATMRSAGRTLSPWMRQGRWTVSKTS